jgi:glyoxylase-like metal-dependent hydrolase (beta-lactamase superfamily II)
VVFSHITRTTRSNVALFPNAQAHDVWGNYRHDQWLMRPAERFPVSPGVRLIETPGHSPQDISTLVATDNGLAVLTHLWWNDNSPSG